MSTPANSNPAVQRRDYNDYTQVISVRHIDDAKFKNVVETAFGSGGDDMWVSANATQRTHKTKY